MNIPIRIPGGGTNEALGLQIDGDQVHLAHLRREGDRTVLVGLHSAGLVSRLDVEEEEEEGPAPEDVGDILGLSDDPVLDIPETAESPSESEEEPVGSNSDVLYRLLGQFPLKQCSLAFSMVETGVFFTTFDDDFGLKGKKLRDRLLEEAAKVSTSDNPLVLKERQTAFKIGEQRLLSIVHEDPLVILDLLDQLKPFVGRLQIGLIEPLEITLMNLVRLAYPADDQVTAIVFTGQDFSRVIFMREGDHLGISQPIHEGVGSPQALRTIYSRILFEQDEANLPDIGRVILTGGCRQLDAQPFFAQQFPNSEVDYLALQELDLSELDLSEVALSEVALSEVARDTGNRISTFSVPIGLAWKSLRAKSPSFYPVNFLPKARRKQQNPLELAWHGLALLAALVATVLFIGFKGKTQIAVIEELQLKVGLDQQQIEENSSYLQLLDDLYAKVADYERNFALIDTLATRRAPASTRLEEVAAAFRSTGGLWLERFSTSEGDIDAQVGARLSAPRDVFMYGKASNRARVPEIAERLGDGYIQSIIRAEIRGRTVYEFDLKVPMVSSRTEP